MLVPAHIVLLIENYFAHTRMKLFRDKGETNAILGMGLMLASGTETRIDWLESNLEVALARARWWSRRTSGSAPDGGREEPPGVLRMVVTKNLRGCSGWWSRRTFGGAPGVLRVMVAKNLRVGHSAKKEPPVVVGFTPGIGAILTKPDDTRSCGAHQKKRAGGEHVPLAILGVPRSFARNFS